MRSTSLQGILVAALVAGCGGRGPAAANPESALPTDPLQAFLATGFQGSLPATGSANDTWTYPELTASGASSGSPVKNNWANLHATCGPTNMYQSPVVIVPSIASTYGSATLTSLSSPSYSMTLGPNPTVHDRTYAFDVPATGAPTLTYTISGSTFTVTPFAFHFHAPAEHVVLGAGAAPMEMHIKATATSRGSTYVMVLAVQFEIGTSGPTLDWLDPVATALLPNTSATFNLGRILDLFVTQPSYSYIGGLTTPPCVLKTGKVTWIVLPQPVLVSQTTLEAIMYQLALVNGGSANARVPQVFNTTGPDYRTLLTVNDALASPR